MSDPTEQIRDRLARIESERDVTVIAARDLGSRACGLAGPDSDYDVMTLFLEPRHAYVETGTCTETITRTYDDPEIEVHAWNLAKFVDELVDADPNAFEFCNSPVRYYGSDQVDDQLDLLTAHVNASFTPIALIKHYRSLAYNNYSKYIRRTITDDESTSYPVVDESDDHWVVETSDSHKYLAKDGRYRETTRDTTVKRNLQVGRALLIARYIEVTHQYPMLDFERFLDVEAPAIDGIPDEDIALVREFVEQKRDGDGDVDIGNAVAPIAERDFDRDIDPENHLGRDRGIDYEQVNAVVRELCSISER